MGRRSEQRIVIAFPVVIRGTDSRGSPFAVTTETHDVSCTGASLKGLQGVAELGRKIEIECQNQKAWYRVQWASADNRKKEWRTGVRCLEPGKYIWGVPPKEWQPDTFDLEAASSPSAISYSAAAPAVATQPPRERRRFARHQCRIEVQVITQGPYGEVLVNGKITDISLSGCYVEMLTPLPSETTVDLAFTVDHKSLHLSGRVCSSQDGFGMGVAFTGMTPEGFEALREFAPPDKDARRNPQPHVAHEPRAVDSPASPAAAVSRAPNLSVSTTRVHSSSSQNGEQHSEMRHSPSDSDLGAFDLPDPAGIVEALVQLLLRKGVVTRAELLEAFERSKAPHT